jgi:hypothetical protein
MPVQKIKSGRIITVQAETYVGDKGTIFYDEFTPELRLSDGTTPGGILFTSGGSGTGTYVLVTATNTRLGGIKVGSGLSIAGDGTLSAIATSTYVLPTASTSTLGGIKIGANLTISPDGTLTANTSTAGVSDSFKTIKVNSQTDLVAVGADTIEFKAGNGIAIETSTTSSPYQSLTITSTGIGNIDGGMFDTVFDTTTLMFDGGTP